MIEFEDNTKWATKARVHKWGKFVPVILNFFNWSSSVRIGNAIHRHVEAELWLALTIFDKIPSQGTEVPRKKKKKGGIASHIAAKNNAQINNDLGGNLPVKISRSSHESKKYD